MTGRTEAARAAWRELLALLNAMPLRDAFKLARDIRRDVDELFPPHNRKDRQS